MTIAVDLGCKATKETNKTTVGSHNENTIELVLPHLLNSEILYKVYDIHSLILITYKSNNALYF